MNELVFLKLGGSLLTDKTRPRALRGDVLARLADEIAGALAGRPGLRLLIGHGSGSFGHVIARARGTRDGVTTPAGWRGYAETASVAAELNRLVVGALWDAGVPALPVQPSASARCRAGELIALDDVRGGVIVSTEEIFRWLAPRLEPDRVVLVGEVAGVLSADPTSGAPAGLIEEITPARLPALMQVLGGSRGVDVTGGMAAKVTEMLALAQATPALAAVQIISGLAPGLVRTVLTDPQARAGTRITR